MNDIKALEKIRNILSKEEDLESLLECELIPTSTRDKIISLLGDSSEVKADIALAGLTVGEFIIDAIRIDPTVIASTDFARAQDLGDIFKFSVFADKLNDLSSASLEGNVQNLKGYVAERFAAQQLQSSGMEIQFPEHANQQGYDLLVNGDPFQVKCLENSSGVIKHIEQYPDIPVIVNEELAGPLSDIDNVYPLQGLSNEAVEETTRESLKAGDDLLDYDIPLIATAIAIGKNSISFFQGRTDFKHGSINVVCDVAGGITGAHTGASGLALCGGLLGPYGVVVGGLVGAIGGGMIGRRIAGHIKRVLGCAKEEEALENALSNFLDDSYKASLKSKNIFERKKQQIISILSDNDRNTRGFLQYARRRLSHETVYLNDKIKELKDSRSKPKILDSTNGDLMVASMNAISLAINAKVHPSAVRHRFDELIAKLNAVKAKRLKLL